MNILFVCTGNTCRSPMSEGLMRKIAEEEHLDIQTESAGIFADIDAPPSKNAIAAMSEYDVDISKHKSKQLNENLMQKGDIILTMTQGHKQLIMPISDKKIFTLNEYAKMDGDIPDPYGGGLEEYEETAKHIYDALKKIAKDIKS